ncbi:SDR family NAD(P)-dependent oxidoreductase, partial [Limibacillus halophilus]
MDDSSKKQPGTVLVTGGSRGIGAAISRKLASSGWRVAINYVSDEEAAQESVEAVRALGGEARAYQADTSDERSVAELFDLAGTELGPLTALVNNAGVTGAVSPFDEATADTLRRALDVNVMGVFLCCQAFIRAAARKHGGAGGSLVNISSVAAQIGSPGEYVWYAATKGAVDSLTTGLSRELAGEGIRVNAVSPGLIDTEIHERESRSPGRVKRIEGMIPLGRAGRA